MHWEPILLLLGMSAALVMIVISWPLRVLPSQLGKQLIRIWCMFFLLISLLFLGIYFPSETKFLNYLRWGFALFWAFALIWEWHEMQIGKKIKKFWLERKKEKTD